MHISVAVSCSFSRWHGRQSLSSPSLTNFSIISQMGKLSAHNSGWPIAAGDGTNSLHNGHENPTGASLDSHELTIYDEIQLWQNTWKQDKIFGVLNFSKHIEQIVSSGCTDAVAIDFLYFIYLSENDDVFITNRKLIVDKWNIEIPIPTLISNFLINRDTSLN